MGFGMGHRLKVSTFFFFFCNVVYLAPFHMPQENLNAGKVISKFGCASLRLAYEVSTWHTGRDGHGAAEELMNRRDFIFQKRIIGVGSDPPFWDCYWKKNVGLKTFENTYCQMIIFSEKNLCGNLIVPVLFEADFQPDVPLGWSCCNVHFRINEQNIISVQLLITDY